MRTASTTIARRSATRAIRGALIVATVACSSADASVSELGTSTLLVDDTGSPSPQSGVALQTRALTRTTAALLIEKDSLFAYGGAWWDVQVRWPEGGEKCAAVLGTRGARGTGTMLDLAQASGLVKYIDSTYKSDGTGGTASSCWPVVLPAMDSIPRSRAAASAARANEYVKYESTGLMESTLTLWIRAIRPRSVEVTGIVQESGATMAQAEFTYRSRVVHPKYQAVLRLPPEPLKPGRGVATFRRYDDGWRLLSLNW